MFKSRLIAGLAVVGAIAATVVGTTVATAASSAPMQRFTALSTHANGQPVVIAQGPIHAKGTDVVLSNSLDRFVFPDGNLRIRHHRVGKTITTVDPVTCYGRQRESGTYRVVRGTGAYRGTTGHGTYHVQVRFVGCQQNKPPRLFMLTITASGPLHR